MRIYAVLEGKGKPPLKHQGPSNENTRAISQVKDEKISSLGLIGFKGFSSTNNAPSR